MAPTKPSTGGSKSRKPSGGSSSSKKSSKSKAKPTGSAPTGISKRKAKSLSLAKPGGAQKTKSNTSSSKLPKKKKRVYTEAELDIPTLNSIIPAGVAKPKGQKKGKKFVDDAVSMRAIMSVVSAEKDGAVESKIMRQRQLEEVREARKAEAEARSESKKEKFEERKEGLKKRGRERRKSAPAGKENGGGEGDGVEKRGKDGKKKERKRVSFG
jgi:60S ribosomal subunit assembly/export protein LOC1